MMNNIVSINESKFLGEYCDAQKNEPALGETLFFSGIFLTAVLPKIIYCTSGGPVSFSVFAVTAAVGIALGVIMHYRLPYEVISCFNTDTIPQAPQGENNGLKIAA
jgi:dipeptide/tripeptide permease